MQLRKDFFNLLNSKFEHVYVVSVKRATDRHKVIEAELDGLDYELFFGADYRDFSIEELEEQGIYNKELSIKNHRYNKPLKGGMLGCSLSHKMVYADIIRNKYSNALILEDDVVAEISNYKNIESAFEQLPANWKLLYLDYNKNEQKPALGFVKQWIYHAQKLIGGVKFTHKAINNLFAKKYAENILIAGYHDFTDAYAVTYEGANILFNLQTPVQWFPDHLLAYASTNKFINAYCVWPKAFRQTSQSSNPELSLINSTSY